jgi:hypothetical protein
MIRNNTGIKNKFIIVDTIIPPKTDSLRPNSLVFQRYSPIASAKIFFSAMMKSRGLAFSFL